MVVSHDQGRSLLKVRRMARDTASEITLISHSNVIYWWPAWLAGYLIAFVSYLQSETITSASGGVSYVHPSNNPGLLFIGLIMLLIIFPKLLLLGLYVTIIFYAIFKRFECFIPAL